MKTDEEIRREYAHHPPKGPSAVDLHQAVREVLADAACKLNNLLPEGRHKALALTSVEEARLWANTAVALGEAE